ncbi:YcjX family protein [Ancylobacter pratisalsi]|uniref:YcjX family protein n=1 Tax=Ancylobacter pratisalsi TaxID=1745854 RepID=A0A6P1YPQ7_9HYPH|nr:YcjX family protein [Ancylobacter pratisalsi]QIB35418.1 YcjX family protein [Ancylobacter pratisalsi]
MPSWYEDLIDEARLTALTLLDRAEDLASPTLRLGITGLSRSGKTVFTTALIHALTRGGRLPVFRAMHEGRIARATLEPQPDDNVPRFDYEGHLAALVDERRWPESTRRISELRLAIDYAPARGGRRTLTLDIVDYPGEWLLDLPLLDSSYGDFAAESLRLASAPARRELAAPFLAALAEVDPAASADEGTARRLAELFTSYLAACRAEAVSMSLLPPGRFLMPGDLEGSPALTFAPIDLTRLTDQGAYTHAPPGSLAAMMQRRYESYKDRVVRPFFRDHFARLDRQIVLIDVLAALNAGPAALADLEAALDGILAAFRVGRNSWLGALFRHRIGKVLFAATKADHLHHTSHDPLEAILRRLVERALSRAEGAGADIDVVALAAVRATREAMVKRGRAHLPAIVGVPEAGQHDANAFDGLAEAAVFPGDLPENPSALFDQSLGFKGLSDAEGGDFRFLRFRPPLVERNGTGQALPLPHIRLDRALEFLIGDRLR